MKGKFLAHRTIAPRLSNLIDEVYDLIKTAISEAEDFVILLHNDGKELTTRIIPVGKATMKDMLDETNKKVKYVAYTDEEHNFTGLEER